MFASIIINCTDWIFNLTIGVFIVILSKNQNDDSLIIKKSDFMKFLNLWVFYDRDNKGWIQLHELCFLLYELPSPLGIGSKMPDYDTFYTNHCIYESKHTYNKLMALLYKEEYAGAATDDIERVVVNNEGYLLLKSKKICIKESRILVLLHDYNIKIYDNTRVYYKDVSKQLIERAFRRTNSDYKLANNQFLKRVLQGWIVKSSGADKTLENTTDMVYVQKILRRRFNFKYKGEKGDTHLGDNIHIIKDEFISKHMDSTSLNKILNEESNELLLSSIMKPIEIEQRMRTNDDHKDEEDKESNVMIDTDRRDEEVIPKAYKRAHTDMKETSNLVSFDKNKHMYSAMDIEAGEDFGFDTPIYEKDESI